jgi:hypothetical protein
VERFAKGVDLGMAFMAAMKRNGSPAKVAV